MSREATQPHSAEFLADYRDFWWNQDFLALMARRWDLGSVRTVLDVGCGHGHWGRTLLPHLASDARLTGIDPEPKWVEKARESAKEKSIADRTRYLEGRAEQIPFPDDSFDLVTCQTVLMHVPDPAAAIREMIRVLRPGGRLFAAEPCNAANSMIRISTRLNESVDERMRLVRFQAILEHGKARLGMGDSSIGDQLPGLFAAAGLDRVQVYLSDRSCPLIPPYTGRGQRVLIDQVLKWADKDIWIWNREETLRCYRAGGGDEGEFEALWQRAMKVTRDEARAMRNGTLVSSGGAMTFLVSGTKPGSVRSQ